MCERADREYRDRLVKDATGAEKRESRLHLSRERPGFGWIVG